MSLCYFPNVPLLLSYRVLGHRQVQEFLGEMITAVVAEAVGFEQSSLELDKRHGPDQVGKHSTAGTWGVFEAKGGKSKLSRKVTSRGAQMSSRWKGAWLREIADNNRGTDEAYDLDQALTRREAMLAVVTSLNVQNRSGGRVGVDFKIGLQKYERGEELKPWTGF